MTLPEAVALAEALKGENAALKGQADAHKAQIATLTGERDQALANATKLTGERDAVSASVVKLTTERDTALASVATLTASQADFDKKLAAKVAELGISGKAAAGAPSTQGQTLDEIRAQMASEKDPAVKAELARKARELRGHKDLF